MMSFFTQVLTFPAERSIRSWPTFSKMMRVCLVAAVVCCCAGKSVIAQGPPEEVGFDQNLGDQVPLDLKLTNQDGEEVELGRYFGEKPVIIMPVYYKCPMLCGLELNGMVRCLRALDATIDMRADQDFEILTFSIDPTETPGLAKNKRKQYLAAYGCPEANNGWQFLTGQQTAIDKLCDAIGFRAKYNEITGEYAHAAGIVICTPEGVISRYLYGVEFSPKDLRLAVVESSKGNVGTLADHALLFCFRYDPTTGKYGLAIMRLLQVSGILTVLMIAGGVSWMLRHDRKSDQKLHSLEGVQHG